MTSTLFEVLFNDQVKENKMDGAYSTHESDEKVLIRIISIVKPTRCTNVFNLFYFGMKHYMFRTVFPSIIRSSRLYIQQYLFDIGASSWFYCRNNITIRGPMKVKLIRMSEKRDHLED